MDLQLHKGFTFVFLCFVSQPDSAVRNCHRRWGRVAAPATRRSLEMLRNVEVHRKTITWLWQAATVLTVLAQRFKKKKKSVMRLESSCVKGSARISRVIKPAGRSSRWSKLKHIYTVLSMFESLGHLMAAQTPEGEKKETIFHTQPLWFVLKRSKIVNFINRKQRLTPVVSLVIWRQLIQIH